MSDKQRNSIWDKQGVIGKILENTPLPKMLEVEQIFDDNAIKDIPGKIAEEFSKQQIIAQIKPGMNIAITAGSRGVANINIIIREICSNVKRLGGNPFIFPAMGSHGGATAEGQLEVLESYGITEETMQAPIKSSMETVIIGHTEDNKPVSIDKHAFSADGIIVVGRVKPHTAFRGTYESGLLKMMAIGMGKQKGAESCHSEGFGKMAENIVTYSDIIMKNSNIILGIAIVENAFDATCIIEAIPVNNIRKREPELLIRAKELMPRIMFPKFDILIVDQIGKNYSGDGADPNIIGTYCTPFASGGPEFQRYVVLDLSDESHGNVSGAGMADFTTKRLFDKADFDITYPNVLTSTVVSVVKIPMVLNNDELAIKAAVYCCTGIDKNKAKIVRIKNSSHIDRIWISEALIEEAKQNPNITISGQVSEFSFDKDRNLDTGSH